jgi:hypothetical protein
MGCHMQPQSRRGRSTYLDAGRVCVLTAGTGTGTGIRVAGERSEKSAVRRGDEKVSNNCKAQLQEALHSGSDVSRLRVCVKGVVSCLWG